MVVEVFSFDDSSSRWSQAARSSGAWFPRSKLPEARIEQRRRGTVISRSRRNASPHAVQSHQHLIRPASSVRPASSQVRQRRLAPLPAKAATLARIRVGELRSAPTTMPASSRARKQRRVPLIAATAWPARTRRLELRTAPTAKAASSRDRSSRRVSLIAASAVVRLGEIVHRSPGL